MPNTTTRLTLQEPLTTDLPSAERLAITNNATTLDNATIVTEGTLASRPLVGSVEHNRVYHATDTKQWFVSDGTNWNTLLTLGFSPLAVHAISTNYTAVAGDLVFATGGSSITVTLPTASANAVVGVFNNNGSATTTVARAGSATINGLGLSAATSVPVGGFNASMVLQSDGTNWYVIAGQQDTGWQNLTLAGGWTTYNPSTSFYTPAVRMVGDTIKFRGAGTGTAIANVATLPSGFAPASNVRLNLLGGTSYYTILAGSTTITASTSITIAYFDGLSYQLS